MRRARREQELPPHVYSARDRVNPTEAVRRFVEAPEREQLRALYSLRLRSAGTTSNRLAAMAFALAAIIAAVSLQAGYFALDTPVWGSWPGIPERTSEAIGWALLTIGVLAALGLWERHMARENADEVHAAALLGAYEDELARRHSAKGPEARRWQRAHPIHWAERNAEGGLTGGRCSCERRFTALERVRRALGFRAAARPRRTAVRS